MSIYYQANPRGGKVGSARAFETPEELWDAACKYFQTCFENPIEVTEIGWYQGKASEHIAYKPRAMHLRGLALFCGTSEITFRKWYDGLPAFRDVLKAIYDVIASQKFEGAMVGLFNPTIAARDLGLAEQVEQRLRADADDQRTLSEEELLEQLKERGLPASILERAGEEQVTEADPELEEREQDE